MCYMTLLSTDSTEDLELGNSSLVRFSREMPGLPGEIYLEHTNKWFIASRHGCSCGFRHLYGESVDLGFGAWHIEYCPEIPGANGQGRTKTEALRSLADAIALILEDRRKDGLRGVPDNAIRERVVVG